MKYAGAEIVVQGAQFEDGVNMIRSMNRAGYKPSFLYQSSAPTYGQQFLDGVGPQNAEGVFSSSSYSPLAKTTDNAEFVKKAGTVILLEVLGAFDLDAFEVSERDILWGVALDSTSEH